MPLAAGVVRLTEPGDGSSVNEAKKIADGLQVRTKQGDVVGTLALPTVRRFLGVPFAVAERWEPPRLPPVRNSTFNASSFGDSCPQDMNGFALTFLELAGVPTTPVPESENCFELGTATKNCGDALGFWRRLYVWYCSISFGQPGAPQLASDNKPQNFGFLDLDAAVQWRIILFGESAGSVATDVYAFAHPNDKIVKGKLETRIFPALFVIDKLYKALFKNPETGMTLNPTLWNTVAGMVGCGNDTSAEQLACMKVVPTKTLEKAVMDSNIALIPLMDNVTMFSDTPARSAAGNFLQVPLLGGNNAQEGDILVLALELFETGTAIPGATQTASEFTTLTKFSCPSSFTARDRTNANVTNWRFQYQAIFPAISTRPELRAAHFSEISIIFGTCDLFTAAAPTLAEIALSKYVQNAWVTLARNPRGGLFELGWPSYIPGTDSLVLLGGPLNETGAAFTKPAFVDFPCAFQRSLLDASTVFSTALVSGA
ncbi:hypothetical protein AMATHDRAFT_48493 [Amanita thiersii Skay4041]|uniref:Carboxylesterase type B domain-containing protein n=1 Tax=Amanita thiersii Skay4041 TaxID=703135 RepID=A0A2A9NK69_9AGAR|nr:hypothetical protein AMATHDRAFT_48493 [Amanita thiersii Skay4041]